MNNRYGSGFGKSMNDKMRRKSGVEMNGGSTRQSRGGGMSGGKGMAKKKTAKKKGGYR
jgi:hypothetical protein